MILKILISLVFFVSCLHCQTGQLNIKQLVSTYQYDANRYRRGLNAQNMNFLIWNETIAKESYEAGIYLLGKFGCDQVWECGSNNCPDVLMPLKLRDERLQHVVLRGYDTEDHAMGRMFEFLGVLAPECGTRYEWFDNKFPHCKRNAIKSYSMTSQVGCTLFQCQNPSSLQFHKEFVCLFDAGSRLPVDSNGKVRLYLPASDSQAPCSACHRGYGGCRQGLCINKSTTGTVSKFILGLILISIMQPLVLNSPSYM